MEDQTSPAGACRETASSGESYCARHAAALLGPARQNRFALPGDFPLADFFPANAQACAAE